MSIRPLSASQSNPYGANDLHPLEMTFRETVQSLETAMEHSSLEDIQENVQKLNTIIEQMQDKRLPYVEKYKDQASRLSEQAAVVSAQMPTPAANDGGPALEPPNTCLQCKQWLKLAKNAKNPMSVLDQIKDGEIRSFTAVQVALLLSSEKRDLALEILKKYVTHPISTEFYVQVFGHRKPDELEGLSVHPERAILFANHILQVELLNAQIYALMPEDLTSLDGEAMNEGSNLLLNRGRGLNRMLCSIPDLAKLYMQNLRENQAEQHLEAYLRSICDVYLHELTNDFNLIPQDHASLGRAIEIITERLQNMHFLSFLFGNNYFNRLPPKLQDLIQKKYMGEVPRNLFPLLTKNPTLMDFLITFPKGDIPESEHLIPFLHSRELALMASVQKSWNQAIQHLVNPKFQEEVECDLQNFAEHQSLLHVRGSAMAIPIDARSCLYTELSSYGPSNSRKAIQDAFRKAVYAKLKQNQGRPQLLTHPAYPSKTFQHFRIIENFYQMPISLDEEVPESVNPNRISFIKAVLKDDPELAFKIINQEPYHIQPLLWATIIEETRNAASILPIIACMDIRFEVAKGMGIQLIASGQINEGVQFLEDYVIPMSVHDDSMLNTDLIPLGYAVTQDSQLASITNILSDIKIRLKYDPTLTVDEMLYAEGWQLRVALWKAIGTETQDASIILPKIQNISRRFEIAKQMATQLIVSGQLSEGIQFIKDQVIPILNASFYRNSNRAILNDLLLPLGFLVTKDFQLDSIANTVASIKILLKDDPGSALKAAGAESIEAQSLIWSAIIEEIQIEEIQGGPIALLSKITDSDVQADIAIKMAKKLLESGKEDQAVQLLKDHIPFLISFGPHSIQLAETNRVLQPLGFHISENFQVAAHKVTIKKDMRDLFSVFALFSFIARLQLSQFEERTT